jgi:hypothetical protein
LVVIIDCYQLGLPKGTKKEEKRVKTVILAMALLSISALMLVGCAFIPIVENCPFQEGQILDLKEGVEQIEGWDGPPSIKPTRTHFIFKEEGVLKAKQLGKLSRLVSSLEAERNIITYRLCEGAWLRVRIHYSEGGLFSSEPAWLQAEYFQEEEK